MDRAENLYESMQLRGFCGEFYYAEIPKCTSGAVLFALGCTAFFAAARWWDLPQLLGNLIA